jgi:hypothetical protein
MRRAIARVAFLGLAVVLGSGIAPAQQTSDTFRWIDFNSSQDDNIVAWVQRSLSASAKWTSIREIGVIYDAALVVTEDRSNPQAPPGSSQVTIWSASLTSHVLAPLVTGVNLRWFDPVRFADDDRDEWPVLYDNCRDCQPNTYFTALYYDLRSHTWSARWISGGHGIAVWNSNHSGADWTQVYALLSNGQGHSALYTWNHFEYPKPRGAEDYLYQYDIDPLNHLERSIAYADPTPPLETVEKKMAGMELDLCRAETAPQDLARGQESPICQDMLDKLNPRKPVTTPPANNRGQSAPPGGRRSAPVAPKAPPTKPPQ